MSIAGAEHVDALGIGARGWHDAAGCAGEPADVHFTVDGSWGGFQESDQV